MSNKHDLPPLPDPDERTRKGCAFSAFAMHDYAIAAIQRLESENEALKKDAERLESENEALRKDASALDLDAAAKKLAECIDYPWDCLHEQDRATMRQHARAVIDAAMTKEQKT